MKLRTLLLCFAASTATGLLNAFPTLNYNDGYPLYSTFYPSSILNVQRKESLKVENGGTGIAERFQFTLTPFGQKATYARDENKNPVFLGDIHGRLNMLGLIYGDLPIGVVQPPLLQTAAAQNYAINPPGGSFTNQSYTDDTQQFGFFAAPLKYRKVGVRGQIAVRAWDFIVSVQGGVADLRQTFTSPINLVDQTPTSQQSDVYPAGTVANPINWAIDQANVEQYLMEPYRAIFQELGVTAAPIQQSGQEDVTVLLTWLHNFPVNMHQDPEEWSHFIFTPFIQIGASLATAKAKDPAKIYDLCLGNNKHNALQFNAGFCLDFFETIELDVQGGLTHFYSKTSVQRVPTSDVQYTLFPYTTTVKWDPGNTWFMAFGTNAYHFLDNLSVYVQYVYMAHLHDHIELITPDPAFIPSRLEKDTSFKIQLANFGFNYDISPNFSLGLGVQYPLARRAAYKAQTILLNIALTF